VSPRAREDSVRPRLQSGACARPLNFTVRRHMKRIATAAVLAGLTVGCVAASAPTLSREESAAVNSAESFIARHGYTSAGHPADQPVMKVELLDVASSDAELVQRRRDTLEPHAFGIAREGPHTYDVLFHRTHNAPGFRAVYVKDSEAVEVIHSTPARLDWVPVPSNNRWRGP
jgi:hypothetical protein